MNKPRVIFVSYERGFFRDDASVWNRFTQYAVDEFELIPLVLSRLEKDECLEQGSVTAIGFTGNIFRRSLKIILAGIAESKKSPGKTLISAQDPFIAGKIAWIISLFAGCPLEIEEHGDFYSGEWAKESVTHSILSVYGRFLFSRAKKIRVVSERIKEHLTALGVSQEKIYVVPVAQDLTELLKKNLSPVREHAFTILAACRFVPQKGLDVLLDAMQLLAEKNIPFHLKLIGAGPLETWIKQRISQEPLTSHVSLHPWMPVEDMWGNVDMFILSSRYEGFARTITEAMAANVPIVMTDVGCARSVLRPDLDGLVVKVGDASALAQALERLLKDATMRETLRHSARERVQALPDSEAIGESLREHWHAALV